MKKIAYCLPNGMSPETFLADYWQKKPLLIKQGLPALVDMFEPDDMLGLALDEEATARLIKQEPQTIPTQSNQTQSNLKQTDKWTVKNSPLQEDDFADLPEKWTALVQNLEQWSPELANLWQAFDFIPQWQRDDIMVSVAPVGGSVGKHYDEYDVFLAQGYGHRRWQLGKYCDENTEFMPNQPIRIFDDMGEIIFDEVLEAGDVLYVPPKLSHYGVATDTCMTFSFGFRRPNIMQVLDSMADIATTKETLFTPLILEQTLQNSGELTTNSINAVKQQLIATLESPLGDELLSQAVSEVVSKRQYDILMPEETLTADEILEALQNGATIKVDYNSRLLYSKQANKTQVYANGQPLERLAEEEIKLLCQLADGKPLNYEQIALMVDVDGTDAIMEWFENGWVWLDY